MSNMLDIHDLIGPLKKLAKVPQAQLGGVSCFFVKNSSIISSGINYNPTGQPLEQVIDGKLVSRPEVIHAEVAAIRAAAKNKIDLSGSVLLLTMSPCIKCANEIVKTNISEVNYLYEWWDKAALELMRKHEIKTKQLNKERL